MNLHSVRSEHESGQARTFSTNRTLFFGGGCNDDGSGEVNCGCGCSSSGCDDDDVNEDFNDDRGGDVDKWRKAAERCCDVLWSGSSMVDSWRMLIEDD